MSIECQLTAVAPGESITLIAVWPSVFMTGDRGASPPTEEKPIDPSPPATSSGFQIQARTRMHTLSASRHNRVLIVWKSTAGSHFAVSTRDFCLCPWFISGAAEPSVYFICPNWAATTGSVSYIFVLPAGAPLPPMDGTMCTVNRPKNQSDPRGCFGILFNFFVLCIFPL